MKLTWMMAGLILAMAPTFGEDVLNLPCTALPTTAVKTVPAPFDGYMELVCTHAGQALRPKDGFLFVFDQGPMYLTALNALKPQMMNETVHFTALTNTPLSEDEIRQLRSELHKVATSPVIDSSTILRLREETSTGASKQIYLLVPTNGGHVLGMECNHDCTPIATDPWFFTIVAKSELDK